MLGNIAHNIQKVHNFESLVDFLRDTLYWPIPDEGLAFEEITYDWSAEDLRLDANTEARIISCRQLQLYNLKFDLSAMARKSNGKTETYQQLQLLDLDSLESQQQWVSSLLNLQTMWNLMLAKPFCAESCEDSLMDPTIMLGFRFGTMIDCCLFALPPVFKTSALRAAVVERVVLLLMIIFH